MNIVFSDHALLKMQQRKLTRKSVIAVVHNPDRVEIVYGRREALYKKFRKRSLKVVIMRRYDKIIVITAHWVA